MRSDKSEVSEVASDLFRFAQKRRLFITESIVFEKSKLFAVRIVKMSNYLKKCKKEFIMSDQLIRAGTSIGANIAEAESAISRKDFTAKMYIAYKECSEAKYWLYVLYHSGYLTSAQYNSVNNDCVEIEKILTAITKRMRTE